MSSKQWICCQIGAREHYAVPRALYQKGQLAVLYTDFWAGSSVITLSKALHFRVLASLGARYDPELEDAPVYSWNWRSFFWEACLRGALNGEKHGSEEEGQYRAFIQVGSRFAIRVREALKRLPNWGTNSIFFAYDTCALEAMEWCRGKGIPCVFNQMDPNRVEVEMVREEEKRWAGWSKCKIKVPEEYFHRREQEWALADRIIVNSEFCRQALLKQGVAAEKLFVVPLCYERGTAALPTITRAKSKRLRVLWLGQVVLRKGIQYLMAAARLLEQEQIQFDVVGPIGISREAIDSAPHNVAFHGRATRDQASNWYRYSDVFVLPTLSDGFAITQIEAMAHGLPVIATPCCGDVVSDGVDGFLVPPRNAEMLARTLRLYITEPELLESQQAAALVKAKQFTLERLTQNLLSLEQSLFE